MTIKQPIAATMALAAASAMMAAPVAAAPVTPPLSISSTYGDTAPAWSAEAVTANRYRHWRHRNRVDAGDILTGVLILGGIAAIASAASRNNEARRSEPRYRDSRYRDSRYRAERGYGADAMTNAIEMCGALYSRGIESIDNASRDRDGWFVSGRLSGARSFACRIDGRGRAMDVGAEQAGRYRGAPYGDDTAYTDRQYSDADYARIRNRAAAGSATRAPYADAPQPAYPGGPVEGYEYAEDYGG